MAKTTKELLDTNVDNAFTNLFDEVKKNRENVFVAVCVTDGKDANKTRMAMHGEASAVLAAICLAIHDFAEKSHLSVTEVILRIANAMSEDE